MVIREPEKNRYAFSKTQVPTIHSQIGNVSHADNVYTLNAIDKYAGICMGKLPCTCRISISFSYDSGSGEFGVLLRTDEQLENGYFIRFEPNYRRVVLDIHPRAGDIPHQVWSERFLSLEKGMHKLAVILDDTAACAYLDDKVALSFRMYHQGDMWGLFSQNPDVSFQNITVNKIASRRCAKA